MTNSEDATKGLTNPFADNGDRTPLHREEPTTMDIDDACDDASDTDSSISSSLPSSFYRENRFTGQRRASISGLSTPKHTEHPILLADAREAAIPRRRVITSIPTENSDDELISTPTRTGLGKQRPTFSRSSSLLTRMYEKGTLLGKHPQSPSPGDELGIRPKGLKSNGSKGSDRIPALPDFSLLDATELDQSTRLCSPVHPPDFGTPPGTPKQTQSIFEPFDNDSNSSNNDDNPFLGPPTRKARFEMDYLSESQWYSDYPHHLTVDYLEDLFNLDRRVMFTNTKSGSGNSPNYLKSNFYINEPPIGIGAYSDVLKVQSKHNKEFYAVKKLLKRVQGARERKHYLNEVRNMWRVEKSSNVLQLLEAWEQKGKIYMRMELCKLGNLKSALMAQKRYRGIDEKRAWKCLRDLASGLRAIHDSNVIHLDIKPENVFISSTGALKIGDFGLSITYPIEVKDINEGDKFYLAQELLNGQCGKYSDIFSLGISMYEIITNQIGDLPGEGPAWHYLRDGELNMSQYMILESQTNEPAVTRSIPVLVSSTSSVSQEAIVGGIGKAKEAEGTKEAGEADGVRKVEIEGIEQESEVSEPSRKELSAESPAPSPVGEESASSPGSPLNQASKSTHRFFSKSMVDLIKEMMQPSFEQRPTAATILKHPMIQSILIKRGGQSSNAGVRASDEAMSGLLLQSI